MSQEHLEFRAGITTDDGRQVKWSGNKRLATIKISEEKWVIFPKLTFENYGQVLAGKTYEIKTADGDIKTVEGDNFVGAFLNSVTVAIPATIIPILIAAFAAYGFAWMRFPGRRVLFIMVVALLVIPLQIALVPILRDYVQLNLNGTFLSIWLAHTGFGLPLATYLLFNYIKGLPRDILESAFIDGASHFTIFLRLIIPLSVPALASFAIFQFLWVWNDYLVALTPLVFAAVFFHNLLGLGLGYGLAHLYRFDPRRKKTLAIEVGMQNAGLGAVLALKHFSVQSALVPAVFATWCVITASILAEVWARAASPMAGRHDRAEALREGQ